MLKETTYSMNDIYLFLKDKCGFPAMADTWKKTYGAYIAVKQSDVQGWLLHQLPGDVADHYLRQLQASVTGTMIESDVDLSDIAVMITDMLDNEDIDLIQGYDLELNDREIELVHVDIDKRVVRNIILEVLKQKLKK